MEIDLSLSKPDLRRQMEANMKDVVANRMTKEQMLTRNIAMYREAFFVANGQKGLFRTVFLFFLLILILVLIAFWKIA